MHFEGDTWTVNCAKVLLPILVWHAGHEKAISYSEADSIIVENCLGKHAMSVIYGRPAGHIGNAILHLAEIWEESIPPINCLLINKKTGLPGQGFEFYVKHFFGLSDTKNLSQEEWRSYSEAIKEKCFVYQKWSDVLDYFKLKEFRPKNPEIDHPARKVRTSKGGYSNEGESKQHQNLKRFILQNPKVIGLIEPGWSGVEEYEFVSGDRVDVLFSNGSKMIAVEVKSSISSDADLERGVFQCVKYRSLCRAEQKANGLPPTGNSILVSERLWNPNLRSLLDVLDVRFHLITDLTR